MEEEPETDPRYEQARLREPLPPGLLRALDGAEASVVSDVLGILGVADAHTLRLAPLATTGPGARMVGRAVTIGFAPAQPGKPAPYSSGDAIGFADPGDVLVLAAGAATDSFWGAHMARFAIHRGVAGVVVDGRVRDSAELRELGLATFSLGATPKSSRGRHVAVSYNEPVDCDGVTIAAGDLVLADPDGVVVVPRRLFGAVERGMAEIERFERFADGARARGASSANIGAAYEECSRAIRGGVG